MKVTGETLKQYAMSGPDGRSTKQAIADWTRRASENSQLAPRARDGEVKLFDTNAPTKPPRKQG
jgi:hypothetical protein